jgi:hypothetical protein
MLSDHAQKRYDAFVQWKQCIDESNTERNGIKGGFFPMSSAGKCARQLAYLYLNYDRPPISARTRRVFEHGSMFEDTVRYVIRNNPYGIRLDCAEQQLRNDDPPMIGHIDGLVWCDTLDHLVDLINGIEPAVSKNESDWSQHHLELKTSAQIGFMNIVKKGMWEAQPEYIVQAQCYLHSLQDRDIQDTWFIVENKNTNNVIGQCVPYLPEKYAEIEQRIKGIHDIIGKGELPGQDYADPDKYPCSYCDYQHICWCDEV